MAIAKNPKDVGRRVRSLRDLPELSREELSAFLGVTFASVNRWENDHTNPSPLAMQQVEQLLAPP